MLGIPHWHMDGRMDGRTLTISMSLPDLIGGDKNLM